MWSIAIYVGESPFCLKPAPGIVNPVLTRDNVSDVAAKFVADPFMHKVGGCWHMFFEVMNQQTQKGEIGLATSVDGLDWAYQQIVLAEAFHLSYPYVFERKNEQYMIPETRRAEAVRLYKADPFPTHWSFVGSLIEGNCADPSIFRFWDRWWMFTCSAPFEHDVLRLYFADDLMGPWIEHPSSPVVESDKRSARPAGRVLVSDNGVIRFAQDCVNRYGNHVRAFEILELTTTSYAEREHPGSPILKASGGGWNAVGMHHIDAHPQPQGGWIACVDGLDGAE
ncbi:MAG: hypothetical protein H7Z16_16980 [Pyrinomonadaceae bacterium]|nr:hypothetical protein [Pyrinomonadaceae bacterium]